MSSFYPDDLYVCESDAVASGMHLSVLTPLIPPKNAAANVIGSSFAVIVQEIKKAELLLKFKRKNMLHYLSPAFLKSDPSGFWEMFFEEQAIAMPASHQFFLEIDLLNKDPYFQGLFDSRVKGLREKIESFYNNLQDSQFHFIRSQNLK